MYVWNTYEMNKRECPRCLNAASGKRNSRNKGTTKRRTFVAHRKKNDATERWRQRDSGMEKKAFRVREIRYKCDSWKVAMGMMSSYESREKMNAPPPVYASSCPTLQSNLSLHSSSYYSEYGGAARRRLSSTGEADTSATSSYEGSDSSENSDESRLEPVSQMEREQLETFFRGLKSQVFVCESLANLYLGSASQTERWELRFTGIPVVVLDLGETRSRSKRRIQILLAERGTCFTLWRETIDNLSSYKVSGPAFHTMCLSSDHTRLAGLSFDNPKAANDLWQHIERLVSCPENISLSIPGKKKKKPAQKKVVLPAKSNISQPCQFQHVTSVDAADRSRYFSLQTMVPPLNELENSLEANF
ncbi:uncharacterized protein LOC122567008 isoform X1 [Bombus pyrosoma]|uniref:uncharacterized protein LOC122567008 isoform X1 n=2 Tax=Bombus pyrosoma TaxID=396416 RepID=UPI001CB8C405|nr:uncharacterized protein LOC122567008 isoform X1 [Bombus pyrosoma]